MLINKGLFCSKLFCLHPWLFILANLVSWVGLKLIVWEFDFHWIRPPSKASKSLISLGFGKQLLLRNFFANWQSFLLRNFVFILFALLLFLLLLFFAVSCFLFSLISFRLFVAFFILKFLLFSLCFKLLLFEFNFFLRC